MSHRSNNTTSRALTAHQLFDGTIDPSTTRQLERLDALIFQNGKLCAYGLAVFTQIGRATWPFASPMNQDIHYVASLMIRGAISPSVCLFVLTQFLQWYVATEYEQQVIEEPDVKFIAKFSKACGWEYETAEIATAIALVAMSSYFTWISSETEPVCLVLEQGRKEFAAMLKNDCARLAA